jgi:hypothetical protein
MLLRDVVEDTLNPLNPLTDAYQTLYSREMEGNVRLPRVVSIVQRRLLVGCLHPHAM